MSMRTATAEPARSSVSVTVRAVFALLVLSNPGLLDAQEDQERQAVAMFSRAAELSNIRTLQSEPFVLRARIRLLELALGPRVGSYTLVWSSPERWRQMIVIGDFTEIRIVNEGKTWWWNSLGYRPLRLSKLIQAMSFIPRLRLEPGESVEKTDMRQVNGVPTRCIQVIGANATFRRELCFNDGLDSVLVRESSLDGREVNEYSDHAALGEKLFPRTLRTFQGDDLVSEVRVQELAAYPDTDPTLFAPPDGQGWRDEWHVEDAWDNNLVPPKPIRTVLPGYTSEATRAGIQGDVYIEAVITAEGEVDHPVLVQALPDEELNRRAIQSILEWDFEPGLKAGEPVPVIGLFLVTFRINDPGGGR